MFYKWADINLWSLKHVCLLLGIGNYDKWIDLRVWIEVVSCLSLHYKIVIVFAVVYYWTLFLSFSTENKQILILFLLFIFCKLHNITFDVNLTNTILCSQKIFFINFFCLIWSLWTNANNIDKILYLKCNWSPEQHNTEHSLN